MMTDLIGIIDEGDYIRYSQKFSKERKQIEKNIKSLKQKIEIIISNEKKTVTNQEIKEKTKNFLKADYINNEILFDFINKIEVDENKRIYIYFNFKQSNVYDSEEIQNVSIS